MSSKPASPFAWATDALYPAGSESFSGTDTKTEPSSGKKAEGWEPKERPAAQAMNWALNALGLWTQYLSDGALAGNHTIDGTLWVNPTVPAAFPHLRVTGDARVTGDYKFLTTRKRHVPACAARSEDNAQPWLFASADPNAWSPTAATVALYYPVFVEEGERLDSVALAIYKGTNSSVVINVALNRHDDATGTVTPLTTGADASNATGHTSITLGSLAHDVVAGCSYYLVVDSSTGGALDRTLGLTIGYTRP